MESYPNYFYRPSRQRVNWSFRFAYKLEHQSKTTPSVALRLIRTWLLEAKCVDVLLAMQVTVNNMVFKGMFVTCRIESFMPCLGSPPHIGHSRMSRPTLHRLLSHRSTPTCLSKTIRLENRCHPHQYPILSPRPQSIESPAPTSQPYTAAAVAVLANRDT